MIKDLSNKNIFKVLATESRRANLTPNQLAIVHKKLGQLLSYEILDFAEMEEIEINHVQGIKKSLSISPSEKYIILVLMRGGLYVAEGIKEIFDGRYKYEFINNNNDILPILNKYKNDADEYNLIIVDSVINTGKTVDQVLSISKQFKFKKQFITTLVIQEKAIEKYSSSDIYLLTVRISPNFYIGKGKTDTGNRIFGTI